MVRRCLILTALAACGPVKGTPPTGDGPTGDPGFQVAVLTTKPTVPVDGRAGIELSVTRTGGFDGEISLAGVTPPNGLQIEALTIAAGDTTAELVVGAITPLAIDDTVSFTVEATADGLPSQQLEFEDAEVTGKPGSLDVSWGPSGTGFGSIRMGGDGGRFDALEVVAGKVLATGFSQPFSPASIATARFTDTGLVDVAFDGNPDPAVVENLIRSDFDGNSGEETVGVAVGHQLDGRIILIGRTASNLGNGVALIQLAPTGLAGFPTFGNLTGARARLNLDPNADPALDLPEQTADGLVLPDDSIAFVGTLGTKQFVGRAGSSGNFLTAFDTDGFIVESLGGDTSAGKSIKVDASGRFVVLGSTTTGGQTDLVVSRYTPNGTLDTFGTGGRTIITTGGALTPVGLAVLSSGKILVAATTPDATSGLHYLLFRLDADGSPDTTFGVDGVTDHLVAVSRAVAMTVLPDGKIMFLGQTGISASLVRFKATGAVDNLFGTAGLSEVVFPDAGSGDAEIGCMAVYDANKIVVGGSDGAASPGNGRTALISRLWF